MSSLRLILGDQLDPGISALKGADKARDVVLMVEVAEEATYVPHHKQKLAFLFSAMRHFAAGLAAQGVEETRESHALKILSQLEARKNRLKQENMALVFPEPEKLAALQAERGATAAKAGELEQSQRAAEERLPALEEERRRAQQALQERRPSPVPSTRPPKPCFGKAP